MARGISINIGVNTTRTDCCGRATLKGAENDAGKMAGIAGASGFAAPVLLAGQQARRQVVEDAIRAAAGELEHGDMLLLTYSGHGCRIFAPASTEPDSYDETWCLADQQLRDDDLHRLLADFAAGVRILVVSDSCHSGSILAVAADGRLAPVSPRRIAKLRRDRKEGRSLAPPAAGRCESPPGIENLRLPLNSGKAEIRASVLLIAACREEQEARDGDPNGLFTTWLARMWEQGFPGTYAEFIRQLHDRVSSQNPRQNPGWTCAGAPDPGLFRKSPFAP